MYARWMTSLIPFFTLCLIVGCSRLPRIHQTSPFTATVKEQKTVQEQPPPAQKVILDAPLISQMPELRNGCEVTSLAMLLQYAGLHVGKMELADQIKKDRDPLRETRRGTITHWGNPSHGFVGDITGQNKGYAVYHQPMEQLMKRYLPERTLNLTGSSFHAVLNQIKTNRPVVIWTTSHFSKPNKWEKWHHGHQSIKATLEEHAVLLVGFDPNAVYVNDPLTGRKAQRVNRQSFIASWQALGRQALSYR